MADAKSSPRNTRELVHGNHNVRLLVTRSVKGVHLAYVYVDGVRYPGIALGKGKGTVAKALDAGERIAKKLIDDGLPEKPLKRPARRRFIDEKYSTRSGRRRG